MIQNLNNNLPQNQLHKENLKFAFNLNQKLQSEHNLFFSPFNISTALALVYLGASNDTKSQIKNTLLGQNYSDEEIHSCFNLYRQFLNDPKKGVATNIANSAFLQQDFPIEKSYALDLQKFYSSQIQHLDFSKSPQKSVETINKWVEAQTNEKIKNLLQQDSIQPFTKLILISAVYFKGGWASKFNEDCTSKNEKFYGENNQISQIDMMFQESEFTYCNCGDFQLLELPYENKLYSMVILLPKEGLKFSDFVNNTLTLNKLSNLEQDLQHPCQQKVQVYLPKFKIQFSTKLSESLKDLGITDAFEPTKADFSKISSNQGLYLQEAVHKAYLEVNEKGSEAAAATGMMMGITSIGEDILQPVPVFRADRSFMYYIKEKKYGNILFMGNFKGKEQ